MAVGAILVLSWGLARGFQTRGSNSEGGRPPVVERPNVLLVLLDTVGAEHVGYEVPGLRHTPYLDGLAREGVVFRRAFSAAPWTQPAVASLFTARMPSSHGVLQPFGVLSPDEVTLAEQLQSAGWETAGFVTHGLLKRPLGYAQGFDHWDESHIGGHEGITSRAVTNAAIEWLDSRRREAPFFLLVHYFDPHYVYQHHPTHDLTRGYGGPLRPAMDIWELRSMRPRLAPADVAYLVGLYREEIAFTDAQLGRLLDHLGGQGALDRTLVLVVADHGEEFMRHGWIGHTRTLYDELLRVPLVLRLPGTLEPRQVDSPVSMIDVAPTLLELVGAKANPEAEGVSMAARLRDGAPLPERAIHAEVSYRPRQGGVRLEQTAFQTALIRGDLKLVHDLTTSRFQLFDRSSDPEEHENLIDTHPRAEELRRELLEWEGSRAAMQSAVLNPTATEIEQLRALGYVRQ